VLYRHVLSQGRGGDAGTARAAGCRGGLSVRSDATEAGSLPLFPIIPEEESKQFFAQIDWLTHWYGDLVLFLAENGLSQQEDDDGEEVSVSLARRQHACRAATMLPPQ
jgi:hypothetical protein